jgi:hypothetical protein
MTKETTSVLKLVGAIAAIFVMISLSVTSTSSGFHLHDTYFVIGAVTQFILFLVLSAFVGSLIASIFSKFRNKLYVRILVFSTLLLFSASIYIFALFAKPH